MTDHVAERSGEKFYPDALADREWWVNWVLAHRYDDEERGGKPTKQPVAPYRNGDADPVPWNHDLPDEEHPTTDLDRVRAWDGMRLGLDLNAPDRVVSDETGTGIIIPRGQTERDDGRRSVVLVDWDDVRDPETGEVHPVAGRALEECDGYAEVSQSGEGIHQFVFGEIPGTQRVFIRHIDEEPFTGDDLPAVEMYQSGRLCAMTGLHVDGSGRDVVEGQDLLDRLCWEYGTAGNAGPGTPSDPFAAERDGDEAVETPSHKQVADALDEAAAFDGEDPAEWEYPDAWSLRYAAIVRGRGRGDELSGVPNWQLNGYAAAAGYADGLDKEEVISNLNDVCDDDDLHREVDQMWRKAADSGHEPPSHATLARRGLLPDRFAERGAPEELPAVGDGGDGGDVPTLPVEPSSVRVEAGLGEDDSITDLDDRERAAVVWELVVQSDEFHVRVRRDNGSLWACDDGVWSADGERALRHAGRQALGSVNYGANVLSELKAQARSDPRVEVDPDEMGVERGCVAVKNGLLNLRAAADGAGRDAIRPLEPDDLALRQLPVHYNPDASAPEWEKCVKQWAERGRAKALQEYVGYCLHVGEMPIHRALLLVGSGANGKGTFLSVVRSLLGSDNTSSIELQTLANEKDAVAQFYESVANIDDDLSARQIGAGLGMFKKLVAGEHVRGRQLYEEGFEFQATGKHLYAANEVPKVDVPDEDEAFWRRWVLVEFPNHYPPSQRDPDLSDRLSTPGALSGVLNWAIEGWDRLLENGSFTGEAASAHEKRQRWQRWGETIDEFISECVEHDDDAPRRSTSDAHARFIAWCRENGKDRESQRQLTDKLKTENVGYTSSIRVDGKVTRGFKSLGFTDDVPEADDREPEDGDDDTRQSSL